MTINYIDLFDRAARFSGPRAALIDDSGTISFAELTALSNRFANALTALGLRRGDRMGVLLQQCPEAAVAHIAAYKAGLIAVPLFVLFGEDALQELACRLDLRMLFPPLLCELALDRRFEHRGAVALQVRPRPLQRGHPGV